MKKKLLLICFLLFLSFFNTVSSQDSLQVRKLHLGTIKTVGDKKGVDLYWQLINKDNQIKIQVLFKNKSENSYNIKMDLKLFAIRGKKKIQTIKLDEIIQSRYDFSDWVIKEYVVKKIVSRVEPFNVFYKKLD